MTPTEFKSSVVEPDDGKVVIALFDGAAEPRAVALLECEPETARALAENIGSALNRQE